MRSDHVILVDSHDRPIGTMDKLRVHELGLLHRAFSIFLFNDRHEMLIQRRAQTKYHSGGLWSNTCCSHPLPGEPMEHALERKLMQEMGLKCWVEKAFEFTYKADMDNGLTEHELDHIYFGDCFEEPRPNPDEVEAWRYIAIEDLRREMNNSPENFTPWFRLLVSPVLEHLALNRRA